MTGWPDPKEPPRVDDAPETGDPRPRDESAPRADDAPTEGGQGLEVSVDPAREARDYGASRRGLRDAGLCVCHIHVPHAAEGDRDASGVLVAPELVLTNYHVIAPIRAHRAWRTGVVIRFDHRSDAPSDGPKREPFGLHADWDVDHSPHHDVKVEDDDDLPEDPDKLDYALVRLDRSTGAEPMPDPLEAIDTGLPEASGHDPLFVRVPFEPTVFKRGQGLQILHHKAGKPLQWSELNHVTVSNTYRVRYRTTTGPGASGAPCFDSAWRLVALHHFGGRAREPRFNQGIPIGAIVTRVNRCVGQYLWGSFPERLRSICLRVARKLAGLSEAVRVPALRCLARVGIDLHGLAFDDSKPLGVLLTEAVSHADAHGWLDHFQSAAGLDFEPEDRARAPGPSRLEAALARSFHARPALDALASEVLGADAKPLAPKSAPIPVVCRALVLRAQLVQGLAALAQAAARACPDAPHYRLIVAQLQSATPTARARRVAPVATDEHARSPGWRGSQVASVLRLIAVVLSAGAVLVIIAAGLEAEAVRRARSAVAKTMDKIYLGPLACWDYDRARRDYAAIIEDPAAEDLVVLKARYYSAFADFLRLVDCTQGPRPRSACSYAPPKSCATVGIAFQSGMDALREFAREDAELRRKVLSSDDGRELDRVRARADLLEIQLRARFGNESAPATLARVDAHRALLHCWKQSQTVRLLGAVIALGNGEAAHALLYAREGIGEIDDPASPRCTAPVDVLAAANELEADPHAKFLETVLPENAFEYDDASPLQPNARELFCALAERAGERLPECSGVDGEPAQAARQVIDRLTASLARRTRAAVSDDGGAPLELPWPACPRAAGTGEIACTPSLDTDARQKRTVCPSDGGDAKPVAFVDVDVAQGATITATTPCASMERVRDRVRIGVDRCLEQIDDPVVELRVDRDGESRTKRFRVSTTTWSSSVLFQIGKALMNRQRMAAARGVFGRVEAREPRLAENWLWSQYRIAMSLLRERVTLGVCEEPRNPDLDKRFHDIETDARIGGLAWGDFEPRMKWLELEYSVRFAQGGGPVRAALAGLRDQCHAFAQSARLWDVVIGLSELGRLGHRATVSELVRELEEVAQRESPKSPAWGECAGFVKEDPSRMALGEFVECGANDPWQSTQMAACDLYRNAHSFFGVVLKSAKLDRLCRHPAMVDRVIGGGILSVALNVKGRVESGWDVDAYAWNARCPLDRTPP